MDLDLVVQKVEMVLKYLLVGLTTSGEAAAEAAASALAVVVVMADLAAEAVVDRKVMVVDLEEDLLLMLEVLHQVILLVDMVVRTAVEAVVVDPTETSMAVMVLLVLLSSHTQPDKYLKT